MLKLVHENIMFKVQFDEQRSWRKPTLRHCKMKYSAQSCTCRCLPLIGSNHDTQPWERNAQLVVEPWSMLHTLLSVAVLAYWKSRRLFFNLCPALGVYKYLSSSIYLCRIPDRRLSPSRARVRTHNVLCTSPLQNSQFINVTMVNWRIHQVKRMHAP